MDWENGRFVVTRHKSSRTAKVPPPRLIPLSDCVLALLRHLQKQHGHLANRDMLRPGQRAADALRPRRPGK